MSGLAGAAAQTVAYPLDLIRRRQQLTRLTTHVGICFQTSDLDIPLIWVWLVGQFRVTAGFAIRLFVVLTMFQNFCFFNAQI